MEAPIFPPRLHDPSRPSSRWRLNRLRRLGGKSLFLPGKRTGFLGQLTRTKHSRQGVRHSAVIRDRYLTPTVGIFSINDTSMRAPTWGEGNDEVLGTCMCACHNHIRLDGRRHIDKKGGGTNRDSARGFSAVRSGHPEQYL